MDWKIRKDAKPQGSSEGFWYDITDGGYIKLEEVLMDKEQIKAVNDAVDLLQSLEETLESEELLNEF